MVHREREAMVAALTKREEREREGGEWGGGVTCSGSSPEQTRINKDGNSSPARSIKRELARGSGKRKRVRALRW